MPIKIATITRQTINSSKVNPERWRGFILGPSSSSWPIRSMREMSVLKPAHCIHANRAHIGRMTAQAPPRVEFLSCTLVEGNGHETEVNLPIHTTKRGRKWIAASPVKMEQHGT